MRPALKEIARRLALLPHLLKSSAQDYLTFPRSRGFVELYWQLAHALPTGIFDNSRIDEYLTGLFSTPGRTNDFRKLRRKLFLVATDLDFGRGGAVRRARLGRCPDCAGRGGECRPARPVSSRRDRRTPLRRRRAGQDAARLGRLAGRREAPAVHQSAGAVQCRCGGRGIRTADASPWWKGGSRRCCRRRSARSSIPACGPAWAAIGTIFPTPTWCCSSRVATMPRCSLPMCSTTGAQAPLRARLSADACRTASPIRGARPVARHGVTIDKAALADEVRTLSRPDAPSGDTAPCGPAPRANSTTPSISWKHCYGYARSALPAGAFSPHQEVRSQDVKDAVESFPPHQRRL